MIKKYRWKKDILTYLNLDLNRLYSRGYIYSKLILKFQGTKYKKKYSNDIELRGLVNFVIIKSIINNVVNYGNSMKKLIL